MKMALLAVQAFCASAGAIMLLGLATGQITIFWTDHLTRYGLTSELIHRIDTTCH